MHKQSEYPQGQRGGIPLEMEAGLLPLDERVLRSRGHSGFWDTGQQFHFPGELPCLAMPSLPVGAPLLPLCSFSPSVQTFTIPCSHRYGCS